MIFSIEGNMGSGKSTFVEDLKNKLPKTMKGRELIFLQEPVDIWCEIKKGGKDIIQLFYENKNKYAFSFQMLAYITRLNLINEIIEKNPNAIIISERSVYTDCNVFAQMLYNQRLIDEAEFQIYKLWFNSFEKNLNKHRFIFLNTNCQECLNRIKKRNGKVYQIGGAVRDELIGKISKDLDLLVTGIETDDLQDLLSQHGKVDAVGKSFGILKFQPTGQSGEPLDISVPRVDVQSTGAGHKDFEVKLGKNISLKESVIQLGYLTADEFDKLVQPNQMISPSKK
mgnify:CR=1 FL=1